MADTPQKMLDLMKQYAGEDREYLPFDWRSPYPHSIYWGTLALEKAQEIKQSILERRKGFGVTSEDIADDLQDRPAWVYRDIDYDRTVYSAFKGLVRHGRLVFNENGQLLPVLGPNYDYADTMLRIYEKMLNKYEGGMFHDSVNRSRASFIRRMSVEFYLMGNREKAVDYWTKLAQNYATEAYDDSFSTYIDNAVDQWVENMDQTDARRLVRGMLTRMFLNLGSGQNARATRLKEKARNLTRKWNEDATTTRWRIPYEDIRDQVLRDIFSGRMRLSDSIIQNLEEQLGEETAEKYRNAAKQQPRRIRPGVTRGGGSNQED